MPKINNNYYIQVTVKYKKSADVLSALSSLNNIYKNKKVHLEIDINPVN